MTQSTLHQQLRALDDARADRLSLAEELKARRQRFDDEQAALIADVKHATERVDGLEREIRVLAESHYAATKDKAPAPGVEIKLFKQYRITDRVAAETWAKDKNLALIPEQLDEKALMKIATVTPLPFVECSEAPRVQIATQLNASAYAAPAPAVEEDPFA